MYADISFQRVRLISADAFTDLASVPLHLKFESMDGTGLHYGQVCFHLENAELAAALVAAINGVLKVPKTEISEPDSETPSSPAPLPPADPLDDDLPF